MTRNGKIARLPLAIRQELNQRPHQGQKGRHLVQWLNGLPEVQAVPAADFKGQPILEYNLSRWKTGGYRSWEKEQNVGDAAVAMILKSSGLKELAKEDLSKRISVFLIAKLMVQLKQLDFMPEGRRKARLQRDLFDRFVALRRGDLETEWLRVEHRKIDFRRLRSRIEGEQELSPVADALGGSGPDQLAPTCAKLR